MISQMSRLHAVSQLQAYSCGSSEVFLETKLDLLLNRTVGN